MEIDASAARYPLRHADARFPRLHAEALFPRLHADARFPRLHADASAATSSRALAPLGIRALLSALAPYLATTRLDAAAASAVSSSLPLLAATSSLLTVDSATANRAATSSPAALVRGHRMSVVDACTAPPLPFSTLIDAVGAYAAPLRFLYAAVDAEAAYSAPLGFLYAAVDAEAAYSAPLRFLYAAVDAEAAYAAPLRFLYAAVVRLDADSYAATGFVDAATASRASSMRAGGDLLVSTAAVSDVESDSAAYTVGLGTVSLTSLRRPSLQRFFSTTSPGKPAASARKLKQMHNYMKRELARVRREMHVIRVRREVGFSSLDALLRDLGYFTKGPFARYFGLFTVFTVMSEGLRECNIRAGQISAALKFLKENGEVKESVLVGDNFSWIFD